MSEKAICPKCGSSITAEKVGDLETLRCTRCSWELGSTVYHGPESTAPASLSARLQWKSGHVSTKEAMAAKKHVPAFAGMSISGLLERFGDSAEYDLGELFRPVALQLKVAAEQDGLVVVLEPASAKTKQ
jgi:hypothetical protein